MDAIRFDNVSYSAGGNGILRNLTFAVGLGEKVCIAGPSGSGKSTILRIAMGVLIPDSGEVFIDGSLLDTTSFAELRSRVAFIDQESVMGAETAEEALLLPFTFKANAGARPDEAAVKAALERTGLGEDVLAKKTRSISGGERQRIALARALLLDKKIIIADEITSALDPGNRDRIIETLMAIERSMLVVSHDVEVAKAFDKTLRISEGALVY